MSIAEEAGIKRTPPCCKRTRLAALREVREMVEKIAACGVTYYQLSKMAATYPPMNSTYHEDRTDCADKIADYIDALIKREEEK